MAIAVVLFPASGETPTLRPCAVEELAARGVTSVALVRDRATIGVVLEGWAFDTDQAPDVARAVLGGGDGARTLRPLMQMAVANPSTEGGRR